ncbi:unnamed protein product [Cylicostephanus goldi]|uniref:Uncharacterized protein n=1 Tax=Cylicostephanus goldi TaxID=71465 RepID=A0A3P6TC36_CYLGO|nr:unnamed protein product [Cylicostephanus goldi]
MHFLVNIDNHIGSCGFFPIYPYITGLYPIRLIKVDHETGELVRDANGLCIPCCPGELGEMVGVIKNKDVLLKFEGYVNKGDTQKKIYRDVFEHGDQVRDSATHYQCTGKPGLFI